MKTTLLFLSVFLSVSLFGQSIIWSDDFDDPSIWTLDNNGQSGIEYGWNINSISDGWYSASGINSTSGGNYAELVNGNPISGTQSANVVYTMTTTNSIDVIGLAGSNQLSLQFEQYGARFNDLQEISISTDGVIFTPIGNNLDQPILSSSGGTAYLNPHVKQINIYPFLTQNNDPIWIRFSWTTNYPNLSDPNVWITYGWYIDDIKLVTNPTDVTLIPDPNFEQALINMGYDDLIDGEVYTYNINSMDSLNVINQNISDLTGIQDFTNLSKLYANQNQLTSLDVTQNIYLKEVLVDYNQITSLSFTQNPDLYIVLCLHNELTNIDVSQNSQLTTLHADENWLSDIDVTQNPLLKSLSLSNNIYTQGLLTSVDVSQNPLLEYLAVNKHQLIGIDLTQNYLLENVLLSSNGITNIDLTQNPLLWNLNLNANQIGSIDLSSNTILTDLALNGNQLTNIDLTQNALLENIGLNDNQIPSLDLTYNPYITTVFADNNPLQLIDVSSLDSLVSLNVAYGELSTLDVSNNIHLMNLRCNNNALNQIDISNNISLNLLDCRYNQLACLDLTNLNLSNFNQCGNYYWGYYLPECFSTVGNLNLNCITVNDTALATDSLTSIDPQTSFSEDCNYPENCDDSTVGITELTNSKNLIQILDLMGRETSFKPNTPLIYVYDDGTTEKAFAIE